MSRVTGPFPVRNFDSLESRFHIIRGWLSQCFEHMVCRRKLKLFHDGDGDIEIKEYTLANGKLPTK